MNHAEMVRELASRLGSTQKDVRRVLKAWSATLLSILDNDQSVTVPGLGTFRVKTRQPRKAYSPGEKKTIRVPAKRVVHFSVSAPLKRRVNTEASDEG
jgi:nucleoid DNA-binding protein